MIEGTTLAGVAAPLGPFTASHRTLSILTPRSWGPALIGAWGPAAAWGQEATWAYPWAMTEQLVLGLYFSFLAHKTSLEMWW